MDGLCFLCIRKVLKDRRTAHSLSRAKWAFLRGAGIIGEQPQKQGQGGETTEGAGQQGERKWKIKVHGKCKCGKGASENSSRGADTHVKNRNIEKKTRGKSEKKHNMLENRTLSFKTES